MGSTAPCSGRRCSRAPRAADTPAAGLEGRKAVESANRRLWRRLARAPEAEAGAPNGPASSPGSAEPPRAAQSRPEPPGASRAGRSGSRAWALLRGAFGHAVRTDELAQLGASQHHLALGVVVVRGGDAVGADALAGRVVRGQQVLQPHAIEAATLGRPGCSPMKVPRGQQALRLDRLRSQALVHIRLQGPPHAVAGSAACGGRAGSTCASASASFSVRISREPQTPCTRHVRQ